MKSRRTYFILPILIVLVLVCSGFSSPQLKELEYLIVEENFEEAEKTSKELLNRNLDDATANEVNYFLGLIKLRLGDYRSAKSIFFDLSRRTQDEHLRDKVYLGLLDAHYLSKEYKVAILTGERYLKDNPHTDYESMFYFKLARINLKLANWVEAREHLKDIIRKYPRSFEVHLARQFLGEKQYFAVQVGAFLDRSKAEMQVKELERKNEYAYIVETVNHLNQTFYRVRVGQLAYLDEAEQLREKLAGLGYPASVYP